VDPFSKSQKKLEKPPRFGGGEALKDMQSTPGLVPARRACTFCFCGLGVQEKSAIQYQNLLQISKPVTFFGRQALEKFFLH
jgi:hypothetical protein